MPILLARQYAAAVLLVSALHGLITPSAFGASSQQPESQAPPISIDTVLVPPIVLRGVPQQIAEELGTRPITLGERLEQANVPGLSIAVVIDGEIAWAEGFGFADTNEMREADSRTLFQAASISKPVAAVGAMRLVELGEIDLDKDIEDYLTSWSIPDPTIDFAWNPAASPLTLRDLLSHNAGTSVRGFPGYDRSTDVPTPVDVLNGLGNTDPVVVEAVPGSRHRYSGGGYTVAQVAMVDASAEFEDFPSLMESLVLEPLGMNDSTFEQPLPKRFHSRAATGYRSDGSPLDGNWVVHPEMAAAGLWTTPSDLARMFVSLQNGMAGNDGSVLSAMSVQEMLRYEGDVAYGLGINVGTERIGHGGGNRGFRCVATFFNEGGDGIVIMSNGDNGWGVNSDVLRTVFVNLDWPGLRPIEKVVVALSDRQLERCTGEYEIPGEGSFSVQTDEYGIGLVVTLPGDDSFRLLPESESVFFDPQDGIPISFEFDIEDRAIRAVWSGSIATRRR